MAGKYSPPVSPARAEAPAIAKATIAPNYLVALADAPGIRAGQIVPNTPENVKALDGKCRPASEVDIGIAGLIRKD